jgi:hypothetical protein
MLMNAMLRSRLPIFTVAAAVLPRVNLLPIFTAAAAVLPQAVLLQKAHG